MTESKLYGILKDAIIEDFQNKISEMDPDGDVPSIDYLHQMVKIIYSEDLKCLIEEVHIKKVSEKIKKFPEEMRKKCIKNYADFYDIDENEVNLINVFYSSAGIQGWAENYGET